MGEGRRKGSRVIHVVLRSLNDPEGCAPRSGVSRAGFRLRLCGFQHRAQPQPRPRLRTRTAEPRYSVEPNSPAGSATEALAPPKRSPWLGRREKSKWRADARGLVLVPVPLLAGCGWPGLATQRDRQGCGSSGDVSASCSARTDRLPKARNLISETVWDGCNNG
jgi:hypothetical protein